jgi:hypothetical protein
MNTQEGDDVFVGPGINVADDDYNDYPEAYQMMPVGGYFKVGEDPCTIEDGADVYYHKHIVQMYSIPYYMLEKIIPNDNDNPPENQNWLHTQPESIYFFDVLNAHDGLCDCL